MAKVTMPLLSGTARGKIANAMVHFPWKGIAVVRQWLIPANPQSTGQGNIRTIIGNLGRAVGMIVVGKVYDVKLKALGVIPNQQTKQSYLVQYIKDTYLAGSGATLVAAYVALRSEVKGHTKSDAFTSGASALTLTAFNSSYDNITSWDARLGCYLLAKAAIALGFTGSPYATALASWTKTQVLKMVSDLITT
jgi:hypothetical protein